MFICLFLRVFKQPLVPTWGSHSQPQDQEPVLYWPLQPGAPKIVFQNNFVCNKIQNFWAWLPHGALFWSLQNPVPFPVAVFLQMREPCVRSQDRRPHGGLLSTQLPAIWGQTLGHLQTWFFTTALVESLLSPTTEIPQCLIVWEHRVSLTREAAGSSTAQARPDLVSQKVCGWTQCSEVSRISGGRCYGIRCEHGRSNRPRRDGREMWIQITQAQHPMFHPMDWVHTHPLAHSHTRPHKHPRPHAHTHIWTHNSLKRERTRKGKEALGNREEGTALEDWCFRPKQQKTEETATGFCSLPGVRLSVIASWVCDDHSISAPIYVRAKGQMIEGHKPLHLEEERITHLRQCLFLPLVSSRTAPPFFF